MIDSIIEPLIDRVQLASLALQKTEKQKYVPHSRDPMDPTLQRGFTECSGAILRAI